MCAATESIGGQDRPTFCPDLNVNVKETTIFSVFHPDAHDLFNTCSDLKKVAWELWDPARRLNAEVYTVLHGKYLCD